jgi:hypothetical protein
MTAFPASPDDSLVAAYTCDYCGASLEARYAAGRVRVVDVDTADHHECRRRVPRRCRLRPEPITPMEQSAALHGRAADAIAELARANEETAERAAIALELAADALMYLARRDRWWRGRGAA